MGTFSESNGDRSGLGRPREHKNEGCVALSVLTQTREPGDRREVSLLRKSPIIMSQTSLVKQISENVPSVPDFVGHQAVAQQRQVVKLKVLA